MEFELRFGETKGWLWVVEGVDYADVSRAFCVTRFRGRGKSVLTINWQLLYRLGLTFKCVCARDRRQQD